MRLPSGARIVLDSNDERARSARCAAPSRSRPREHYRELLAAPARGDVDLAHALAERLRELDQDAVADRVAVAVVDGLEAVEVGQRERDRPAEALGAPQLAREHLLAVAPVREAGEHVDERLPSDDPV